MKRKNAIQNNPIYKYRYWLAGAVLALVAVFMAVYRFWDLPGGLSAAEIQSATVSGNLSLNSIVKGALGDPGTAQSIINLPWSVLQWLSIKLFGLSVMSVTLPAVILGLASVGLIIWLLAKITKPSLAIMGGLLTVSSSFIICMSRSGTPAVMTTFLLATLLLASYYYINRPDDRKRWSLLFVIAALAGLSYMTAGFYIVLAMALVGLLHPQVRLALLTDKKRLAALIGSYLILTIPIWLGGIMGLAKGNHELIGGLISLGAPSLQHLRALAAAYGGFNATMVDGLVVPMITVVGAIMAAIGLIVVALDRVSSIRFYLLIAAIVPTVIMGAFQPGLVYLLFIPTIILETICLGYFTDKWYGLFPVNPYARVFAILPLAILLGSLSSVDMGRFFNAVNYSPSVVYSYDWGITKVNEILSAEKDKDYNYTVAVPAKQASFYNILMRHHGNIRIAAVDDQAFAKGELDSTIAEWALNKDGNDRLLMLGDGDVKQSDNVKLVMIKTNWWKKGNLVVREYK